MPQQTTVAVLGTGIMGAAMARSLLRADVRVRAWNRTRARADPLTADGAEVFDSPADAVRGADVVLTILSDAASVAAVLRDAAPGLRAGQPLVQSSTVGVAAVPDLVAAASGYGLVMLDAPVLGTRQPAEQGALQVFVAGPSSVRPAVTPVLDAIGSRTRWLGERAEDATATRLKMVVNSWVLALTTGVAEALSLADGLGIDPALFLETVAGGAMDSPYLQTKGRAIIDRQLAPSFALDTAAKDARLIVADAEAVGLRLDVATAVAARFARAAELGHGDEDMAATYFASVEQ